MHSRLNRLLLGLALSVGASLGFAQSFTPTPDLPTPVPVVTPPASAAPLAGSPTLAAGIIDSAAQIDTLMQNMAGSMTPPAGGAVSAPDPSTGEFGYNLAVYKTFNSTPIFYILGLPLGAILQDNGHIQATMAAMLLLAIAISIGTHLQAGSSNLEYLSTLIGKVMILGVIQANPGVLYATCMTVMDAGRVAVTELRTLADNQPGGVAQRLIQVLSHSPLQDSQMTQARNRGIMAGLSDRQGVFTQYTNKPGPDLGLLSFYASYLNAYATAQANQPNAHQYAALPAPTANTLDELRPDIIRRYISIAVDSSNVPASASGVGNSPTALTLSYSWTVDSNTAAYTWQVNSLASAIATRTDPITQQLNRTDNSATGLSARNDLLAQYEQVVRETTGWWADKYMIDPFRSASYSPPQGGGVLSSIYGLFQNIQQKFLGVLYKASVGGAIDMLTGIMNSVILFPTHFIIPILGVTMTFLLRLLLEMSLLGVILSGPLWLFEPTKKAFTGAIGTMVSCSVILPFWMFFQLLLDLIFAALRTILVLPNIMSLAAVEQGLAIMYLIATVYMAFKTPAMVKGFLTGGAWATTLLGTVAKAGITSVVAAGMVAATVATGGAGGVAFAGAGAAGAGAAGAGAAGAAGAGAGAAGAGAGAGAAGAGGMSQGGRMVADAGIRGGKIMAGELSSAVEQTEVEATPVYDRAMSENSAKKSE
jgi:hypothetical protein